MPVVEAHFFAPEDLNGSTIFECSSDDAFLKGIRLEIQRDKLGNGLIEFARKVGTALFDRGIVQPEVFVRFLVPEISATDYLWGCFLDYRQQKLVSVKERGGEGFRFGGPGPKFYLTRTVLWSASFAGYDNAVHRDEHVWTWPESARAGAILNRLILEDQSNPSGPYLPDLTKSFSDANDSAGVPWAEDIAAGADEFSLNIGDDYLKILWTLENAGSLVTQMTLGTVATPLLQLDAYQTFGRDLTGAIAADTVHFTEGVNILTDLDVEGASLRKASHALVQGADGVYELAVRPSWDSSQYRKVAFHVYENTDNNTWLDKAGVRFLQRQENGEKQIKLRWQPGFDPASGLYMPGPDGSSGHVWVGDTVDLTTGGSAQTELDYDGDPQLVTGIQMELLKAVRDDSAEEAARSWKLTALLNYDRESNATVPAGGTTGGSGTDSHIDRPAYRLCRPMGASSAPAFVDAAAQGNDSATTVVPIEVAANDLLLLAFVSTNAGAVTGAEWFQTAIGGAIGVDASPEALSLVDQNTAGSDHDMEVWGLLGPDQSTDTDSNMTASHPDGRNAGAVLLYEGTDGATVADTIRDTFTATGTGTAPSVAYTCQNGDRVVAAVAWHGDAGLGADTVDHLDGHAAGFTQRAIAGSGGTHNCGIQAMDRAASETSGTASWTLDSSRQWIAYVVVLKGTGAATEGDGHPDLVGSSVRIKRCDDTEHYHTAADPSVNDDGSAGFRPMTLWFNTEAGTTWMLLDNTDGAAEWVLIAANTAAALPGSDTASEVTTAALLAQAVHGKFIATFHRDSDEDAYLLLSDDGITWEDPKGEALFTPVATSGDARDPSITHFDGRWWLVQTGSEDATADGFDLWVSDDLLTWTHVDAINIEGTFPSATAVWAPEWIRHSDGSPYLNPSTGFPGVVVGIASSAGPTDFELYEMHATNRGLTAWSAPTEITGTGLPAEMIDGQLLYVPEFDDGTPWKLWYKDEVTKHIEYAESASMTTGYSVVEDGNWAGWKVTDSIEGPNVVKLDDGRWRIYFNENDGFNSVAVYYSDSTDDWSTWTARAAIDTPYLMSHGTVLYLRNTFDHARDPHAHSELLGSIVSGLDDLSDATITTPAEGDMLRYDGSAWVNSALRWEPVVTDTGSGPELVFTGGDIVMTWVDYG